MPIFTPTQVQGALAPLRAPQASKPSANPLNVLTAVSAFQRARTLDQQAQALELRERQNKRDNELREQLAIFKSQSDLFEQINQQFHQGVARNSRKRQENNASSYGLNRDFFPTQAAKVDAINNSFLKRAVDAASNVKGLRGASQAQIEVIQAMSEMNRVLASDTDYQTALKNQIRYDELVNNVSELASSKNLSVNATEINKLEDKLIQSGDPKDPIILRGSDFAIDRFIFDDKLGQVNLAQTVEEATGKINFARFSKEGPDGFITIEKGEKQRAIDEARNLAFDAIKLSNDRNILGMADNIALQQGTTRDEAVLGMIEGKLGTFRNKLDDVPTDLSITKDVVGTSATGEKPRFKDEELNEIVEEIESQGFKVNDPDKIRDIEAARARFRKDPKTIEPVIETPEGDKLIFSQAGEEIARFVNPDFEIDPNTIVGVQRRPEFETAPGEKITKKDLNEELKDEGVNVSLKKGVQFEGLADNAVNVLKSLPEEFNQDSLVLTSALRDEELNEEAHGADTSFHLTGEALDFRTKNEKGKEFAEWVTGSGEGQQWLQERGYKAIWEDIGGPNEHLHLEPLERTKTPATQTKLNPLDKFF
jgi:hypothetical protein